MRKIYRIARTELQTLFYSPIAWLILIVFTFQTCMVFVQEMEGYVRSQALGYGVYSVTSRLYASWDGCILECTELPVSLYAIADYGVDEPGVEQWFD